MSPSEILQQLVAIPSVNPMRREVSGANYGESRMSDWLVGFFNSIGATHERIEVLPGRDNVLARYDASHTDTTIMLDAHQDTVPIDGMTIPPFEPRQEAGKIFGRGAADVKGGMAAMLHAFARLFRERPRNCANVILSCTCDEESTALGIRDLVTYWQPGCTKSRLLAQPPSAAIVAEPTDLDVVVAHRGVLRFRVCTQGRACHSSHPELGKNAIYSMAAVVRWLERHAEKLATQAASHPLCGGPRLSVGRIEGGIAVNVVPDYCFIEVDRRLIPGEDPRAVWMELEQGVTRCADNVVCEPAWISSPALDNARNPELAEELMTAVRSVVGARRTLGVPYCTNASALGSAGIPTVVFGPGDIAQAHTCNEFIQVDQLDAAAEIYFRFCKSAII